MQLNKPPVTEPDLAHCDALLTVYFDGACPVCSREIALYRRQPGAEQCVWVDASSCAEADLGSGLSRASALARFHVRRGDGELIGGMRGFAALWHSLPRFAWAGRLASIGPLPLLLDAAYRAFLWVRPIWQRLRTAQTSKSPIRASGYVPVARRVGSAGLTDGACADSPQSHGSGAKTANPPGVYLRSSSDVADRLGQAA